MKSATRWRTLWSTISRHCLRAVRCPTVSTRRYLRIEGFAFFVPAKTWPAIIQKMHADTVSTLADTATKDKLEHLGVVVVSSTPEQLASHLKAEMDKWGPVIRDARITIDLDAR